MEREGESGRGMMEGRGREGRGRWKISDPWVLEMTLDGLPPPAINPDMKSSLLE